MAASGPEIGRRRLMLGAGATALVTSSLRGTGVAEAKPTPAPPNSRQLPKSDQSVDAAALRSNPLSGMTYRGVSFADFHPVGEDNWRLLAATGFTSSGGVLFATLDIPAGAVTRDVEWYFLNPGVGIEVGASVWRPGIFSLFKMGTNNYAASTGPQVRRIAIPAAFQIAHPAGSKLILTMLSNGKPQDAEIVGARAGFSGGGAVNLRDVPYRAYDSRTAAAGILLAGGTRTIAIPVAVAPTGTSALVINLTAVGAAAGGFLRAYGAHAAAPASSSINYGPSTAIANGLLVGISANRLVRVYSSATAHFIVDVLGTVA